MINRYIRELPFPATSHITNEMVKEILAIPDEEIDYTQEEVEWMERAIRNLDFMIAHAKSCRLDTLRIYGRRAQVEVTLENYKKKIASYPQK